MPPLIIKATFVCNAISKTGDDISWVHVLTTIPDIGTIGHGIVNGAYSYYTKGTIGLICPSVAGYMRFEIPYKELEPWLLKQ